MTSTVRALEPGDDRSRFASGNVDLDRFFARFAGQNQFRHHIGTTYVAVDQNGDIIGFATVSAAELTTAHLPAKTARRLPAYPLPVLRLARNLPVLPGPTLDLLRFCHRYYHHPLGATVANALPA